MSGGIYLIQDDGKLVEMSERGYDTEALLQGYLARHHDLLAGDQIDGTAPRRWLLVAREASLASEEDGAGRWSVDHLFLDQDAVPTVVEVKRSTDTRIRREVVGQMLDYAANAVKYWPVASLQESLEKTAESEAKSVDELLEQLRPGLDPAEFWRTVETNLKAGRIRMLFVADALPPELVRVIEFLNEQMSPAEVLGVELQQFVGEQHIVYVPRVVGRTSGAVATKGGAGQAGQTWDRDSFFSAAQGRCSAAEVALMRRLVEDAETRGLKVNWGRGVTPGASGWYPVGGQPTGVWVLNANNESSTTRAYLVLYLADLLPKLGGERIERAARMLETLPTLREKIAAARQSEWKKYPSLYLADIAGDPAREQILFGALGDLLAES